MVRKVFFVALLVFGIIATYGQLAEELELKEDISDKVIESIQTSLQATPAQCAHQHTLHYLIGKKSPKDHLVSATHNRLTWTKPTDVKIPLQYPPHGRPCESTLTFAEVIANQNSTSSRAYITEGRIGQRHMTITLEVKGALFLEYSVQFYGLGNGH